MPRVKRITRSIPRLSVNVSTIELNDYSDGMDRFISNDKFPVKDGATNMWRLAQDARIITLGEYETRKGVDYYTDAAGVTMDQSQVSITGAADYGFSQTTWLAEPFTPTTVGRLTKLDIKLNNSLSATGTPLIEVYSDSSGNPGTLLARSSVAASTLTASSAYVTIRFFEPPLLATSTTYWIVARIQATGNGSYAWSGTSAASNAKVSTDSGTTWSSQSYSLNFRQYYATDGALKGICRATKSDGTKMTLIAHGTTLYKVNDVTGALTSIKTGLSASATDYQFEFKNDTFYYVNGYDGYRKYDGTTESQISTTNYTLITHHKGLMFLQRKDDPNKIDFTNFADYETFTSTDFIYVPAPKAGDPVVAMESLNGYLLVWTLKNKFILSGDDNATFSLDEAPDQNGTYTQQTVTKDDNFVYYLTATGVMRSNGSEAQLLSMNAHSDILALNTSGACVVVNRGRLYLWYKSAGSNYNDSCYVWNLNFGSGSHPALESHDTDSFVSRAFTAFDDSHDLIVGSSIVGQAFWQELDSNDYTNLGGDINFELQNHYFTFGTPSVDKQISLLIPRSAAQSGNYTIDCDYAADQRDNWQTASSVATQGIGPIWGSFVWGEATWGTTAEVSPRLTIPGEYNRIALRYKHYATRQPHAFRGHTIRTRLRRLR